MNPFDKNILLFLNSFINRWPWVDRLLEEFQSNDLLKGSVLVAMCWYLWFSRPERESDVVAIRQKLVGAIYAMVIGIVIARTMANLLPYRLRPSMNPELHLVTPAHFQPVGLLTWSGFPSDHAVVWFALATGLCLTHRLLGIVAILYVSFLSFGRVYLLIHNPSDVVVGAAIGVALALLMARERVRAMLYAPIAMLQERYPGWFYAAAFLATYQIANMFAEVRFLATLAWHGLKLLVR